MCYGVTVLRYYDECIVMEVWMRGEYTVEALMLSRGQGESRKTFSRPAGLNDTFLLLDPIFASMRVWFALFLFSDPDCSFLPALCQPFSILSGSGTHFFCSGTQFLLLYGSGSHFFSSQTRGALLFWHYVNLFPFSTGLARDFSPLELRLFLLSAPDSNLFDDSSHIFQHCFIPFSHLSGILIIVKRKSPLTQFLFHNMAGKYPTSYRLLLLFIK